MADSAASDRPVRSADRGSGGGNALFRVYKSGQGTYVRWCTAAGAGLIALGGARFLHANPIVDVAQVRILTPVVLFAALAYVIFYFVGQHRRFVDFLIATEGEMKKVNWSTRREVIGATKVVIVTVLGLALILFLIDVFLMFSLEELGVLKLGLLRQLFPGGPS